MASQVDAPVDERLLAEALRSALFRTVAGILRREEQLVDVPDLSLTQRALLNTLSRRGRSRIVDLATHEQVSVTRMTNAIRRLVNLGLVRRIRDLSDRRNIWFDITNAGVRCQQALIADLMQSAVTDLQPAEIQALITALEPLQRLSHRL